jgi:hypothetical protein
VNQNLRSSCLRITEAGRAKPARLHKKLKMKRTLIPFVVVFAVISFAQDIKTPGPNQVVHVATALDHLTVLEFTEPVAMAAAGSSAFEIERRENKVFVKPLKAGASTDLFIWTSSRRFAYELEPAGEVKNMNFAIDSPAPVPKPAPHPEEQMERIADMMLTKALLGAEHINNESIRDRKGRIVVRIEHVFQSKNTLYLHYSLRNLSAHSYRVPVPKVQQVLPVHSAISLPALSRTQLDHEMLGKLGRATRVDVVAAENSELEKQDVAPGNETQGVVAIRRQFVPATVLEIDLGSDHGHPITATLVL